MNKTTTALKTQNGRAVDTHHADQLISHYKKERWAENSRKLGKADSLSTWYGLDELQAFLEDARENQADGIKMYFGVYPSNYEAIPEFSGRQTVVLVATKKKSTEQGVTNKDIYVQKDGKSEILAFNLGQLCPPWCGGTEFPVDGDGWFGMNMEKLGISLVQKGDDIVVI